MARLIDANALLRKICGESCGCEPEQCGFIDEYRHERCKAGQYVANAPAVDRWISVKDRLPEVGKVVLAFGTRSATTGMFQGVSARNDLWWWKGHTIKHVSHWMPIPNLPKECDDDAPDRC